MIELDIATAALLALALGVLWLATRHERPARRIVTVIAVGLAALLLWGQMIHNRQTIAELERQHCPESAP